MKKFFTNHTAPKLKLSIFLEGMRQLKFPGIIYIIIAAFQVFLLPSTFYDGIIYQKQYVLTEYIDFYFEAYILYAAFLSAMFIFGAMLYMSHFMRSGKARDFYCSTPNSVGTIWLNFSASVFAWTVMGICVSHLPNTIVMLVRDVKTLACCMQALAGNIVFAFMILSIMMLAITLSGRIINVLMTVAGLVFVPFTLWGSFNSWVNAYYSNFGFVTYPEGFYLCDPLSIFLNEITGHVFVYNGIYYDDFNILEIFSSANAILFCLLMGVIYVAVSLLFASVRTGDTAGSPFVNKTAHVVSLLSVILPVCCLLTSLLPNIISGFWLFGYRLNIDDCLYSIVAAILIVAIFAAAFWICEFLFTFDAKHSHRAYKYLPIPVVISLVILGAGYLCRNAEFKTTVDVNDVESFSLVRNENLDDSLAIFRLEKTYGRTVTEDSSFKDPEIIKYIASYINDYVEFYNKNSKSAFDKASDLNEQRYGGTSDVQMISVALNLRNGKKITRSIPFDKKHIEQMEAAITSDKEYMNKFLALPDSEKLNIDFEITGLTSKEATAIYDCFIEEYRAMSDEQKLNYMKKSLYSNYSFDSVDTEMPEVTVGENVSDSDVGTVGKENPVSDIKLVSKSYKPGDYYIQGCQIVPGTLEAGDFILEIGGYEEGHLYESNYFFDQNMVIDMATFPKTYAFIVKTCNSKIPKILDTLNDVDYDDYCYVDISADYFGTQKCATISYSLVTSNNYDYAESESNQYWYGEYYDEYDGEYKSVDVQTVTVDSSAMVKKLLSDAASTGDSIDFSKPYCKVTIRIFNIKHDVERDFYVQTDFKPIS